MAEIKSISVISSKLDANETVFYIFRVVEAGGNSYLCAKRYSQFESLQSDILASGRPLPQNAGLPPKRFKLFVTHTTPAFIEERRVLLENFLRKLCQVPDIAQGAPFTAFLGSDREQDTEQTQKIEQDQKNYSQSMPEDVEITGVTIPATRTMSDHVLYQIDLENNKKRQSFSRWTVLKRFGQIYDMDAQLRAEFAGQLHILSAMPQLPARQVKIMTNHLDQAFVESRRVLLENYLSKMLRVVDVVRNRTFLTFLGVDTD